MWGDKAAEGEGDPGQMLLSSIAESQPGDWSEKFPTLIEALPTFGVLGISVQLSDRERMEQELSRESWQRQEKGRSRGDTSLSDAHMQAFMQD